ncbi:MAG TPA: hypothetical protein VKA18_15440 [Alphaproteobacteria bacterium]|nr:hypothetical protein [Alphaproteobacteria bacterium]
MNRIHLLSPNTPTTLKRHAAVNAQTIIAVITFARICSVEAPAGEAPATPIANALKIATTAGQGQRGHA